METGNILFVFIIVLFFSLLANHSAQAIKCCRGTWGDFTGIDVTGTLTNITVTGPLNGIQGGECSCPCRTSEGDDGRYAYSDPVDHSLDSLGAS